jgi:hypothetical protein
MIGKIRVAHAPWMNHGWHAALQPNARGLGIMPTTASGERTFTLTLDLCRHAIVLWISDGGREELPLNAGSIAALHKRLVAMLERHDLPATFNGRPNEIEGAVPFAEDKTRREYERDSAERFREALAAMLPVFARFRADCRAYPIESHAKPIATRSAAPASGRAEQPPPSPSSTATFIPNPTASARRRSRTASSTRPTASSCCLMQGCAGRTIRKRC